MGRTKIKLSLGLRLGKSIRVIEWYSNLSDCNYILGKITNCIIDTHTVMIVVI